jgi:hypothetical protein
VSFKTDADKFAERAREHLKKATKDITRILIDECSGHEGYSKKSLRDQYNTIMEILDD